LCHFQIHHHRLDINNVQNRRFTTTVGITSSTEANILDPFLRIC
jgi:hypothetical protein